MAQKQYLDDSGNPISPQAKQYLDDNGNPVSSPQAEPAPKVDIGTMSQTPLRERLTTMKDRDPQHPTENVMGNIGASFLAPLLHPIDTAKTLARTTVPGMIYDLAKGRPSVYQDMASDVKEHPDQAIESTIGQSALFDTAGEIAGEIAPRLRTAEATPKPEPNALAPRAKALTRASGTSTAVDIPQAWQRTLPELSETVRAAGKPYEGIKGLQQVVQDTMERTQNRYALGLQKIAGDQAVTTKVGDDIRAMRIDDPANEAEVRRNRYLTAKAGEWDQAYTYRQLDRLREDAGNRLRSYYKDKPSNQAAAAKQDVNLAIDRVLDRDLGDVVYRAVDKANGLPEGTTRNLKLSQSSLYKLRDQLTSRSIAMSNEGAQGILDRVRAHSYISSGGHIGAAIGKLTEAMYPETARVGRAVNKGLAPGKTPVQPSNTPIEPPVSLPAPIAVPQTKNPTDAWSQQSQQ